MTETDLIEWMKCPTCIQRYPRAAFLNKDQCYQCQVAVASLIADAARVFARTLDQKARAGTLSVVDIIDAYQPLKHAIDHAQ